MKHFRREGYILVSFPIGDIQFPDGLTLNLIALGLILLIANLIF